MPKGHTDQSGGDSESDGKSATSSDTGETDSAMDDEPGMFSSWKLWTTSHADTITQKNLVPHRRTVMEVSPTECLVRFMDPIPIY